MSYTTKESLPPLGATVVSLMKAKNGVEKSTKDGKMGVWQHIAPGALPFDVAKENNIDCSMAKSLRFKNLTSPYWRVFCLARNKPGQSSDMLRIPTGKLTVMKDEASKQNIQQEIDFGKQKEKPSFKSYTDTKSVATILVSATRLIATKPELDFKTAIDIVRNGIRNIMDGTACV